MIGLYKGLEALQSGSPEAAVLLEQIGLSGDPRAWRELAWMRLEALGIPRAPQHGATPVPLDPSEKGGEAKAIDLLEKAAAQGVAAAARDLAELHAQGRLSSGVHDERAVWWYQRGAELGDPESAYMAGVMILTGRGTRPNPEASVEHFREAAQNGHVQAKLYLGHAYANGDGVERNPALAVKHYLRSAGRGIRSALFAAEGLRADVVAQANNGDAEAWYQLAELMQRAGDDGRALAAYERAAGLSHGPAMYEMATRAREGDGTPQSLSRMAELLNQAAEQGCSNAQHDVGFMHRSGTEVPQDLDEAIRWYRRAAETGNHISKSDLTVLLAERGAPEDLVERVRWLRPLAKEDGAAAFNLAEAHRDGVGTPHNALEAARWFFKAQILGVGEAVAALGDLRKVLSRAQLHTAERMAGGDGRVTDTLFDSAD